MRIGIGLARAVATLTLEKLVAAAQRAERDGFATAWLSHAFGFDALTVLAIAGRETDRIELGSAVVPTYPRHPAALAQQGADRPGRDRQPAYARYRPEPPRHDGGRARA